MSPIDPTAAGGRPDSAASARFAGSSDEPPWWRTRPRPPPTLVLSGRFLHDSPEQTALLKDAIGRTRRVFPYLTETWGDATPESLARYALIVKIADTHRCPLDLSVFVCGFFSRLKGGRTWQQ
ncbi:MAG: hypothetical protein HY332_16310 [Chloroflexi bacterium]|nr:hypothetical protein [Chloroflexota bacterium]